MQIQDLRNELLDKIISIHDEDLLQKLADLVGQVNPEEPVFKVTEAQKVMLEGSFKDIQNGNFVTDEALNKEEEKWLNG